MKQVERKIYKVEGFEVRIKHLDGRDVRSDRSALPSYPYERAMMNRGSVTDWIGGRFTPTYAGFDVEVLRADGSKVHGRTLLSTARDTYLAD